MEPMAANMEWANPRSEETSDDFVRRFREPVYRIALAVTGKREIAEDVTQDTLLRGLAHRRSLADPMAWLRVVAARRAISYLRGSKARPAAPEEHRVDDPSASIAVQLVLDRLPAEQQALLALAIGQGWTYAEIAEALQVPPGTVASRINAAKEAFRRKWGSYDES